MHHHHTHTSRHTQGLCSQCGLQHCHLPNKEICIYAPLTPSGSFYVQAARLFPYMAGDLPKKEIPIKCSHTHAEPGSSTPKSWHAVLTEILIKYTCPNAVILSILHFLELPAGRWVAQHGYTIIPSTLAVIATFLYGPWVKKHQFCLPLRWNDSGTYHPHAATFCFFLLAFETPMHVSFSVWFVQMCLKLSELYWYQFACTHEAGTPCAFLVALWVVRWVVSLHICTLSHLRWMADSEDPHWTLNSDLMCKSEPTVWFLTSVHEVHGVLGFSA